MVERRLALAMSVVALSEKRFFLRERLIMARREGGGDLDSDETLSRPLRRCFSEREDPVFLEETVGGRTEDSGGR